MNTGALCLNGERVFTNNGSCTSGRPLELLMESRMRRDSQVRFGGSGEETTGRKAGIGASPLTLRERPRPSGEAE